jgi:hypothetical protein
MEDGGVDTTVIESRQHKMGQMPDLPPLLAFSVFKLTIYILGRTTFTVQYELL